MNDPIGIKEGQAIIDRLLYEDLVNFNQPKIVQYVLEGGKRLRPLIISSIGGGRGSAAGCFALAVEYIHNASLIIDDLPCMDNDTTRRGVKTLHTQYNEQTAILTAINMQIRGMMNLIEGFKRAEPLYSVADYRLLSDVLKNKIIAKIGSEGLCYGQHIDLTINKDVLLKSRREQQEAITRLCELKTGCLFAISFILGWISIGGKTTLINEIEQAGYAFGMCYQIIDDLVDYPEDKKKTGGFNNVCRYYTHNEIIDLFTDKITLFVKTMSKHKLWDRIITELYQFMMDRFTEAINPL
jgi:geranylgeranyl diphosphate synthase type II